MTGPDATALRLRGAGLRFGDRTLWSGMDLDVVPGKVVAVLGANGAGKSSLLRVILGLLPLSDGSAEVLGAPVRRGRRDIGYLPQTREHDRDVALRARDLVRLGVDGHRWGCWPDRRTTRRVDDLLESVGAAAFADQPLSRLSGGERQRLRVAQAVAADPRLLLCDEPLQSLDLTAQRVVVDLVDRHRRETGAAVVFVTHEINPVLSVVDRVLYIIDGAFRFGPTEEVMTSETLSGLYGSEVEVIRRRDRLIVIGGDGAPVDHCHARADGRVA